jgi:inosose dehydratase
MSAQIRVANAPVSWGVMQVAGWSPPISYGVVLDEIAAAGYEATELGPYAFYPTDAAKLRTELSRRALSLTAAFIPHRLKETAEIEQTLARVRQVGRLLTDCGARFLGLADRPCAERLACQPRAGEAEPHLTAQEWKTVGMNVRKIVAAARELGLRCVFHHHAGSYIETPTEVEMLFNEVDAEHLGLCLDTGHYYYGGGDPVEAVRKYGPRVEYLHLKDVDAAALELARRERLLFTDAVRQGVFSQLGHGAVDFEALVRELGALGYEGWAVVEQDIDALDPNAPRPIESARASRQFLRSLGI